MPESKNPEDGNKPMALKSIFTVSALAACALCHAADTNKVRPAPTYYLAAQASCWDVDEIDVKGASNLPPGSVIGVQVAEFYEDAWKDYSNVVFTELGTNGFFTAVVHPLSKLTFRRNVVAEIFFGPVYHAQPPHVLAVVGRKGENLDELVNPQTGKVSGENFYLSAIARVEGCGIRTDSTNPTGVIKGKVR